MKTLGVIFAVVMICLAFLVLLPSRDSNGLSSRTGSQVEEVVYMSDIDRLVTAVMLYGVTNGITFQGTNYVFVVEDVGPATPPGLVVPRETTFHLDGEPDETYLIEGSLNTTKLSELGLYDEINSVWTKNPTSVEIGSAVTSIGSSLFTYCGDLTSITIPDSVTSIGGSAFESCSGLSTMTIPISVTSIEGYVFYDCGSLTSVTMSGKTMSTVQGMDSYPWGIPSGCVIHCTDGDITVQ